MDYRFNKTLLVILSLSSLLLSSNAVPSTRVGDFISTSVPAAAPKSSSIDFTSTSFPAKAHKVHKAHKAHKAHKVAKVVTKVDPEITKLCTIDGDVTDNCIEPLSKLFQGPFDIVKALEIELNTTLSQAKTLYNTVMKLRNDSSTDKRAIDALDTCLDEYDCILRSTNETLELIPQQNFAHSYDNVGFLLTYTSSCQLAWNKSPGLKMPWNEETLIQSISISFNILLYIVENHKF